MLSNNACDILKNFIYKLFLYYFILIFILFISLYRYLYIIYNYS